MAFDLSFSPEFFFQEGEPYDGGPGPSERPTSVWQALESMSDEQTERVADRMGCKTEHLCLESVLEQIQKVNTCTSLTSPVEVWIDEAGHETLRVYDRGQ